MFKDVPRWNCRVPRWDWSIGLAAPIRNGQSWELAADHPKPLEVEGLLGVHRKHCGWPETKAPLQPQAMFPDLRKKKTQSLTVTKISHIVIAVMVSKTMTLWHYDARYHPPLRGHVLQRQQPASIPSSPWPAQRGAPPRPWEPNLGAEPATGATGSRGIFGISKLRKYTGSRTCPLKVFLGILVSS